MLTRKVDNEAMIKDYMYCNYYRGPVAVVEKKCQYTRWSLWCHECPRGGKWEEEESKKGGGNDISNGVG